jgi:hypothetical protein
MIGFGLGLWDNHGVGTSFNPLTLSPALWLDAADSATLFQATTGSVPAAADGDPVGYWLDKSGNNRHASQTSGSNKPILKTAIQNSKNIVRTNGTSSFMTISTMTMNAPFAIYLVVKKPSSAAVMELAGLNGDNNKYLFENYSDSKTYYPFKNSSNTNLNIFTSPTMDIYSSFVLLNASTNGTTGTLKRNNVAITNSPQSSANATNGSWDLLFKGYSGGFSSMDVAETLWFQSAHDDATQTLIINYLNTKWGVY